ncbi:hypothetical protein B566_EDAN006165 [Ephemera danica]|nr:hypothetical protein B566_EDAN006165 [Ephemera danica]
MAKEDKMRRLQQRREQAVHESRTQAYTTAELRDQIKRTMSPETFDRLVARSALEARVTASRTPLTGSPPSCTRSHILLG